MVGMGPVGIDHNLLEGVCGHLCPEIFNLEPSESGFEAFFQGTGSCGVTDRF